jgi:hypothetical protein
LDRNLAGLFWLARMNCPMHFKTDKASGPVLLLKTGPDGF